MTQQYPPPPPWGQPGPHQPPDPRQWQGYGQQPPPVAKKPSFWRVRGGALVLLVVALLAAMILAGGGDESSNVEAGSPAPAVLEPAKPITARDWQLIAKDPAAHAGQRIIVYGQVTQFDAATGADGFRANVDGVEHPADGGYADYDTNTILNGEAAALREVIDGDLFKAEATVEGARSYDTQIGESTTVPELTVTKIAVTGHAN